MKIRLILLLMLLSTNVFSQMPMLEPGVSQELAKWRAVRYSNVRYKLDLTLEKMSPVLKGRLEVKLSYAAEACSECPPRFIVLDWRKIRGHEDKSTISNVSINGRPAVQSAGLGSSPAGGETSPGNRVRDNSGTLNYSERDEHLIFNEGVVMGENVIKLDFTSPILTSGSAITRYLDKEDGSEYIYSLFVPSDASTAFPVFDQPDLKARFQLSLAVPGDWLAVTNTNTENLLDVSYGGGPRIKRQNLVPPVVRIAHFQETKPISTYVFAFAAGPFERFEAGGGNLSGSEGAPSQQSVSGQQGTLPTGRVSASETSGSNSNVQPPATAGGTDLGGAVYVRKSQAGKFKPHADEVFRLNREAVRYFEEYFDYKFPWPKYDLVLIPEFPFGGMEHAGATFLREASVIFPQEPTRNDHINRATLIFHEAAHQWFGDTVTMRWFDDLWLKEGFATFTAYKALEKIMPEMNAWKVFYERVKQGAYQTDSTRGTTPIYQEIPNLSAAKSAYGAIVYNKAPAFLRQAEFYLGEDKFRAAVRSFLKKHEFGNAGWEDLVNELAEANFNEVRSSARFRNESGEFRRVQEANNRKHVQAWAEAWVRNPGVRTIRVRYDTTLKQAQDTEYIEQSNLPFLLAFNLLAISGENREVRKKGIVAVYDRVNVLTVAHSIEKQLIFPNYGDYGYGIFLLDEKSREYVLKNIQNEKDPFLRSMMWGALWDSVREGELDPKEYVELVVKVLGSPAYRRPPQDDESTISLLLNRVGTAMSYYVPPSKEPSPSPSNEVINGGRTVVGTGSDDLQSSVEIMLMGEMQREGSSLGRRLTFYRALLTLASSLNARSYLKQILAGDTTGRVDEIPLKAKDKFDIVTRLLILNDPDAPKLLADLEKTETSDEAKRYAYAARAGIATAENKARYWKDFTENKEISESWIEAAFVPWNSIRQSELTLPYLERALRELPNHKRNRKIFFVNGWLGAFIGGQRSEEALAVVNKFLTDNPNLDRDLRLKILENVDIIERAVKIRKSFPKNLEKN